MSDRIDRRLSPLYNFFYAGPRSTNRRAKAAHRRAAQPRAHPGGWQRKRFPDPARMPASTTSLERQASERKLCIATSLRAMR